MDGSHRIRPHEISIPAIFFDGACNEGITGCGAWIKLSRRERIHLHWNGGPGTNNKAEIMALWGGLLAAVNLNLTEVHIYGDSKLIIDCISGRQNMNNPGLHGWLKRTQRLWHKLDNPPISHIYRENNMTADGLSKRGINAVFGILQVVHFRDGAQIWNSSIPIP